MAQAHPNDEPEGIELLTVTRVGSDDEESLREVPRGVCDDGALAYLKRSLHILFIGDTCRVRSLNLLMLFTPFAIISEHGGWGKGSTFIFSLLAIAPFAERIGFVTEQLALHTNSTLGGLLNATFGNATELIISMFALYKGRHSATMLRIVQVSLLGSILSNLLLVLGCAFLLGGVKFSTQTFNRTGATTNTALLMIAVVAVLFPAALHLSRTEEIAACGVSLLQFSRVTSILLLFTYCAFLYFQLKTHIHVFEDAEDDDDDEVKHLGFWGSLCWLGVFTVFISLLSEYLVGAIQGATTDLGLSPLFIGTIIIPIVGNAAEHASAIIFAMRNKMEISVGIAVGSSTQIALSVIPFCVIMGWFIGAPLSMYFHIYETACLLCTVVIVHFVIAGGESNWLVGWMLIVVYIIVAIGFFIHKDPASAKFCATGGLTETTT